MNLLKQYSSFLNDLKKNSHIESIIIFGSYASERIKPLSDLDVALIFSKGASEKERDFILASTTEYLDLVDFSKLALSLQFKIMTQGKIYFSSKNLKSLKYSITNQWFDFKPRLQKRFEKRGLLTT